MIKIHNIKKHVQYRLELDGIEWTYYKPYIIITFPDKDCYMIVTYYKENKKDTQYCIHNQKYQKLRPDMKALAYEEVHGEYEKNLVFTLFYTIFLENEPFFIHTVYGDQENICITD